VCDHEKGIERNAESYAYLFKIELVLREFISKHLEEAFGSSWYKTRCPPEIKQKYIDGLKIAKSGRLWRKLPLTPLYFSDFPHLRIIIQRNDNWKDVFSLRLDANFLRALESVETVRNSIAHGR
jgi:hypothetical protein